MQTTINGESDYERPSEVQDPDLSVVDAFVGAGVGRSVHRPPQVGLSRLVVRGSNFYHRD